MVYPNRVDKIVTSALVVSMPALVIFVAICRVRIDAWALDAKRKSGEAKPYSQLFPPVEVVMRDWQFVARLRDYAGYVVTCCLVYFIGRAIWLAAV